MTRSRRVRRPRIASCAENPRFHDHSNEPIIVCPTSRRWGQLSPRSLRAMAEPPGMTISGTELDPANAFAVRVQKIAQDQAKQDGKQAVALIEEAARPVGPNGEGSHVNTVA